MPRSKSNEQKQNAKPVRSGKENKRNRKNEKASDAAVAKKKKTTNKKNARLEKWKEPENQVLLEGWARKGLSMEQIAHNMGISKDTLYRWIKTSSDISDAIKKGKEVTDFMVENALFTAAISGNVVAQIFWLKNRNPEVWKDKVEQKIEQKVEAEVENTGGIAFLPPRLEANNG